METVIKNTEEKMKKAISNMEGRFTLVRAGRANPRILDPVMVKYYGVDTPLISLATISVPEARQIIIKPFDRSCISDIEKGIYEANIGLTPNNNGEMITLVIPELTEERKKRLLKLFENGEMTNQVISAMPQTILDDPKAMEKIAESILSNSNYTDKIYSIVKSQEHFGDIFSKLDTEKKEKVAEVDALQKKIEILNSQIEDEKNGISTEEVKKLT